jgi:glutaredoxin
MTESNLSKTDNHATTDPANGAQCELVMYSRATPCPFVSLARRVLDRESVAYRELFIDQDKTAEKRVLAWTGFLSVPTLVVALPGEDLPMGSPTPLPQGASPRGIDRGTMLTEPSEEQLMAWLSRFGFIGTARENNAQARI